MISPERQVSNKKIHTQKITSKLYLNSLKCLEIIFTFSENIKHFTYIANVIILKYKKNERVLYQTNMCNFVQKQENTPVENVQFSQTLKY